MGKYKNHEELAAYAPWKWRRNTTQKSYLDGMNRIAPPGKKAKERRGTNFEENTALPQSVEWHHNWDIALFDGTEIEHPAAQSRQRSLEEAFPPPRKEPYLPPYPGGKESFPPAGAFLPHTLKKEPGAGKAVPRLTRGDVRVEVWAERDRLHVGIQDKSTGEYVASWWDDEAREMMEQGFFYCPGPLGWRIPAERIKLEESVLGYAEEQGLLTPVRAR